MIRHVLALLTLLLLLVICPGLTWPAEPPPQAKPAATAAQWQQNPAAAEQAGLAAATTLQTAATAATWVAYALGGVLTVLGACRTIPGLGGMICGLLHTAGEAMLPAKVRGVREAERDIHDTAAMTGRTLVHLIQELPNQDTIAKLKDRIIGKAPSEVRDWINSRVRQLEADGIDHDDLLTLVGERVAPAAVTG